MFVSVYAVASQQLSGTQLSVNDDCWVLQGLKRQEQNVMMDIYRARNPQHSQATAMATGDQRSVHGSASSGSTAGGVMASLASFNFDQESSRIKRLEKLIKRKL